MIYHHPPHQLQKQLTQDPSSHHGARGSLGGQDLYALDLGTTKFCLATIQFRTPFEPPTLKKVMVPADGMHRGMVNHMTKAQRALDQLITLAEQEFGRDIKHIHLGVAGSHLSSRITSSTLDLAGDTITTEDQHTLLEMCAQTGAARQQEVLHALPIHYQIDARELMECATGFSGNFLTGTSFVIESDKSYLRDLIRLCNSCGLKVKTLSAEPLASAAVVVPTELKQQGVIVLDIGGGTTDGIAFRHGKPVKLITVNVGGEIMSRDLATCLRINLRDAHQLKHHFGLSYLSPSAPPPVECRNSHGELITVSAEMVYDILSCRISELYELVEHEVKPLGELFTAGMIITGGGSELAYLSDYLTAKHDIMVTKNKPTLPIKLAQQATAGGEHTTPFATVAGLLYLASQGPMAEVSHKATSHFKSLFNWLREIA